MLLHCSFPSFILTPMPLIFIDPVSVSCFYLPVSCLGHLSPPPPQGRQPELGKDSIIKLLEQVDSWIPTPTRDLDKPFLMPIEDVFSIVGRGTVTTGRVERGVMKKGDEAEIIGLNSKLKTTITGL